MTLDLEFDVRSKSDQYNVIMYLYPSKRTRILINSMNRTSIRYDGEIEKLEEIETISKQQNQ